MGATRLPPTASRRWDLARVDIKWQTVNRPRQACSPFARDLDFDSRLAHDNESMLKAEFSGKNGPVRGDPIVLGRTRAKDAVELASVHG